MAVEIERKYLVDNDKWKDHIEAETTIRQAYLATVAKSSIRVRICQGRAWLNIKGATVGIRRREYEYEIPLADAEEMIAELRDGAVIHKVRYKVRSGDHLWDLDLFHGENAGLVVAEIELQREDEPFVLPEWAGAEVSGDSRYYNASLVKYPYRAW